MTCQIRENQWENRDGTIYMPSHIYLTQRIVQDVHQCMLKVRQSTMTSLKQTSKHSTDYLLHVPWCFDSSPSSLASFWAQQQECVGHLDTTASHRPWFTATWQQETATLLRQGRRSKIHCCCVYRTHLQSAPPVNRALPWECWDLFELKYYTKKQPDKKSNNLPNVSFSE